MAVIERTISSYPVSPHANRGGLKAGQNRIGLMLLLPGGNRICGRHPVSVSVGTRIVAIRIHRRDDGAALHRF
jgi:hypothetical protein